MVKLGQHYTGELFSQLLIDKLATKDPKKIIELGVGKGALIKAAIKKWIHASCYVTDIDARSVKRIKSELPLVNSFHLDILKENVAERLKLIPGTIDLAICNPPYLSLKNDKSYNHLFEAAQLDECQKLKLVTSDIVFLAKNLQLLKKEGELGIIIPDSLATGKEFMNLRYSLLKNHSIKGVIQLPENIFPKTQALTHILFIEKNAQSSGSTSLFVANKLGKITDEIVVRDNHLVDRMDFKFQKWRLTQPKTKQTLKSIGADIKRGNLTEIQLKGTGDQYLHTTNIPSATCSLNLKSSRFVKTVAVMAKKGDLIVTRVGRSSKVAIIAKGNIAISDCLFRIRIPEKYRNTVLKRLSSIEGTNWLSACRHGVCAKVISITDLYNFPIK